MKSRFLRLPQAVSEYFNDDLDAFVEVSFAAGMILFTRWAVVPVRLAEKGDFKRPTGEQRELMERRTLSGFHVLPDWAGRQVLVTGTGLLRFLWYRDHGDFREGERPSFFNSPVSELLDRKAWFDVPGHVNEFRITSADTWVSRKHLKRAMEQHFGASSEPVARAWPWGDYETALLRHLAATADRFWKNYSAEEPDTAETKKVIVDWLKSRGVSDRTAEQIDTILRAENLPKGPRGKK